MKKTAFFIFIFIFSLVPNHIFSQSQSQLELEPDRFILNKYVLNDAKLDHLTNDISSYVFRKKNGFEWPITKIVFSQENDQLKVDITAIDNAWNKLREIGESPYGYCIINNRIFIISKKENDMVDLSKYFIPVDDSGRTFYAHPETRTIAKNPKWSYIFSADSVFPSLLHSANLELLGK